MRRAWLLIAAAASVTGCGTDLAAVDYGDPTAPGPDDAPTLTLVAPAANAALTTPIVDVVLAPASMVGIEAVELSVDDGPFLAATSSADEWTVHEVALFPGANQLTARTWDIEGRTAVLDAAVEYTGLEPSARLWSPARGAPVDPASVTLVGRAVAAGASTLQTVEVAVGNGGWLPATVDADGTFTATLTAPTGAAEVAQVRVTDDGGRQSTLRTDVTFDTVTPALEIQSPTPGDVIGESVVAVALSAEDALGLAVVEVQVGEAAWVLAQGPPWEAPVNLQPGWNVIRARATDLAGHVAAAEVSVFRTRRVSLRTDAAVDASRELELTLDAAGLAALATEEAKDEIIMLYLDVRDVLQEAVQALFDPEGYGVDTSTWGVAEWNMQRLMTMTPDVADVSGTSMAPLLALAGNLGVPVPTLLAEIADIGITQTFLSPTELADAVYANVVAPHPGMAVDPADGVLKVPLTLRDVLEDLEPLGTKLGPVGDHPGFLFASVASPVLLPTFSLTVRGTSNLIPFEGIDLSTGKAWLFAVVAAGADVVDFDFLDEDSWDATGIANEPEVDLPVLISEHGTWVPPGDTQIANPDEGYFKGDGLVWGLPTWTFEHLVADAIYRSDRDRYAATGHKHTFVHDVGSIEDAAVIDWDGGWVDIQTAGGIGSPPPPAYWWDMVLELAQVRLHDGGLGEGQADLRLRLDGVRVPLTSEQLLEASRIALDGQKSAVAEALVGDHSDYDSDCDVFVVRGADARVYLFYVEPSDLPGATVDHPTRGFFTDAALTERASTRADLGSGDTLHEKVLVRDDVAITYFAADADGSVWRLTVQPDAGGLLAVDVDPAESTP